MKQFAQYHILISLKVYILVVLITLLHGGNVAGKTGQPIERQEPGLRLRIEQQDVAGGDGFAQRLLSHFDLQARKTQINPFQTNHLINDQPRHGKLLADCAKKLNTVALYYDNLVAHENHEENNPAQSKEHVDSAKLYLDPLPVPTLQTAKPNHIAALTDGFKKYKSTTEHEDTTSATAEHDTLSDINTANAAYHSNNAALTPLPEVAQPTTVYAHHHTVVIDCPRNADAKIYTLSGVLTSSVIVKAGEINSIQLPNGFYTVVVEGRTWKMMIR
jgi:hypothetical protein